MSNTFFVVLHNTGVEIEEIQSEILGAIRKVLENNGVSFEADSGWGDERCLLITGNRPGLRYWLHEVVEDRYRGSFFWDLDLDMHPVIEPA